QLTSDTDCSQPEHLDRLDADGVRFVFGYDPLKVLVQRADALEESEYVRLEREADQVFAGKRRAKQPRVKEDVIRERGFKNLILSHEDVAEFDYQPTKATKSYRMIALRKSIDEERGQLWIDTHTRYFFYITNDREMSAEQVVREANDRCNQERRSRAPGAAEHAERELGLHGDRLAGVDPQGVVRDAAPRLASLARPPPRAARPDPTHGVPHLRADADVDPSAGPADRSPARLPTPRVEARAADPLPTRPRSRHELSARPARRTGARAGRSSGKNRERTRGRSDARPPARDLRGLSPTPRCDRRPPSSRRPAPRLGSRLIED